MAPSIKGSKRVADDTQKGQAQAPLAKRIKDVLKQQDLAQFKFQAIAASIEGASYLGEDHRKMLIAMLPYSVVVPSDERGEHQKAVVSMIEAELLKLTEMQSEAVQAEHAKVQELTYSRGSLDGKVLESEAATKTAAETFEAKKAAAADQVAEAGVKGVALKERATEEKDGNASLEKTKIELALFTAAISEHLAALKQGVETVNEAKTHQGAIIPLLKSIKADGSLIASFPSMSEKKPEDRGPFDNMVMEQLEQILQKKADEMEEELAAGAPAVAARASATAAAQEDLDGAKAARGQAEEDAKIAELVLTNAQDSEKAAKDAITNHEPNLQKAVEQRDAKEAGFKQFKEQVLAIFEQLRDRISKKLMREQAAEAAAKAAEEASKAAADAAAREAAEAAAKESREAAAAAVAAATKAKEAEDVAAAAAAAAAKLTEETSATSPDVEMAAPAEAANAEALSEVPCKVAEPTSAENRLLSAQAGC